MKLAMTNVGIRHPWIVVIPCHCTKKKRDILDMYPEQAHLVAAGTEIRIGENNEP